jgi:CO/xanthine dehydrogenase Mo-binding subunit
MRGNESIAPTLVRTLRDVSLADVGRALNPRECEAQEEGAVMMALGHTFVKQMVHENSQLLNPLSAVIQ